MFHLLLYSSSFLFCIFHLIHTEEFYFDEGLYLTFDSSVFPFALVTSLKPPLENLNVGLFWGSDKDHFVRLGLNTQTNPPTVEFYLENLQDIQNKQLQILDLLNGIHSFQLFLFGQQNTSSINAAFQIDDREIIFFPDTFTVTGANFGRYFDYTVQVRNISKRALSKYEN